MNVTASMALKLVPERLQSQPVFLCIDDTMVAKFGKKFEDVSNLFDHAAHSGLPGKHLESIRVDMLPS